MHSKIWLIGLGLTAMVLIAGFAVFTYLQPYSFHGSLIDPPVRAADFTLTAQDGKSFRLSDQTGNVVVMFFGYTSCPDVCPTTMADFRRMRTELGVQADRVRFVFVTVDPARDTVDRVRGYVTGFDPSFIGLTGSLNELEPVWKSYGVYRAKQTGGTALGYLMDHSSRTYVIDAGGNLRLTYVYGTDRADIVHDLQYLLQEKSMPAAHSMGSTSDANPDSAVFTAGNLRIEKVWARPAQTGNTTAVYLSITNTGTQADALVDVNSSVARFSEIHETKMENEIMKMQRTFRIDLPPGQKVEFKPGGYHIMLVTLMTDVKPGEKLSLNLIFERAGKVAVEAEVISP